jgi:N-carbamoyl-L-amino-acid hydrolase
MATLTINQERFKTDFEALSKIGATAQGGVNRPAFSPAHIKARDWFRKQALKAGLEVRIDGAGNNSAILHQDKASKTLLLGSHLDSVPDGGRFDGALGVVAGLEVLRTVKETELRLNTHLEVIDFTDEESSLVDYLGSRALAGLLQPEDLRAPMGGRSNFEVGLARSGMKEDEIFTARRDPGSLKGYLELHIEQGPRLEMAGARIGIVSAIVGIRAYHLIFQGKANHAGTTPMETRSDASLGASAFLLAAREITLRDAPDCVENVGNLHFSPGVFNVIPGQVDASLEIRSIDEASLDALETSLLARARIEAERFGLGLEIKAVSRALPVRMDPNAQSALWQATETLGLSPLTIPSGAGHDAQVLAQITSTGMVFVPSAGGVSHAPSELTIWEDCVNGANVLLGAAVRMAGIKNPID